MPSENVKNGKRKTETSRHLRKSLIHALLGLPDNSRGQVCCHTSLPPVSFRYSADQAGMAAQPETPSLVRPDIAPDCQEGAIPAADDAPHGQRALPAINSRQVPDHEAPQQNTNPCGAAQVQSKQPTEHKPPEQQSMLQTSNRETAATTVLSPPASPLLHRPAQPETTATGHEDFDETQRPAPLSVKQQIVADTGMQGVSLAEEITVPGASLPQRRFSLLSSLTDSEETPVATEKPIAPRPKADDAGGITVAPAFAAKNSASQRPQNDQGAGPGEAEQQVATIIRQLLQVTPAEPGARNDAAEPDRVHQPARQMHTAHNRPAPATELEAHTPVMPGRRPAEQLGTADPQTAADNGEAIDRLDQLGRSFQQLLAKQATRNRPKEEPPRVEAAKKGRKPPLKQVVIIRQNQAGPPQKTSAAFWERSYQGRSRFTIIR